MHCTTYASLLALDLYCRLAQYVCLKAAVMQDEGQHLISQEIDWTVHQSSVSAKTARVDCHEEALSQKVSSVTASRCNASVGKILTFAMCCRLTFRSQQTLTLQSQTLQPSLTPNRYDAAQSMYNFPGIYS